MHCLTLKKNNKLIENCPFQSCTRTWKSLKRTNDEHIRFCVDCEKNVHYTKEEKEFVQLVKEGKCVAFFINWEEAVVGGVETPYERYS